MRNRAKCKKCETIIESFHSSDHVTCKCGSIDVLGGDSMRCAADDWKNFMRVDDEGNEIIPEIKESQSVEAKKISSQITRNELIDILDKMVKDIEQLPPGAMQASITHYDFASLIMLISSIFKTEK